MVHPLQCPGARRHLGVLPGASTRCPNAPCRRRLPGAARLPAYRRARHLAGILILAFVVMLRPASRRATGARVSHRRRPPARRRLSRPSTGCGTVSGRWDSRRQAVPPRRELPEARRRFTGVHGQFSDLTAKRLELLKEMTPKTRRALVVTNSDKWSSSSGRSPRSRSCQPPSAG